VAALLVGRRWPPTLKPRAFGLRRRQSRVSRSATSAKLLELAYYPLFVLVVPAHIDGIRAFVARATYRGWCI